MKKILLYFLFAGFIWSGCNTWIGKQYVNTVSRYNRIYHAQKIIRETDEDIRKAYKDDFNQLLPVFNLGSESSLKANGGEMDKVLKKTSKVIEKHPKSKWADDAWFLMGQSYFYRGDFFAAIENFEYVSSKYKETDIAYRANLWTLYSYILMEKESESLAIITKLKNEKSFPEKYKKGLFLSAAEIAIKQRKTSIALENINKAIPLLKDRGQKIRTHFIAGQLYQILDSFDQASFHFNRVIKYTPPYDFNFNAQINLASALVQSEGKSYKRAQSVLQRMLKDDKNIEYYGRIYYELGKVDEMANQPLAALKHYKTAAAQNQSNSILKTNVYNSIGKLYFEQEDFINSELYYDSANGTLSENHPNFNSLANRREDQVNLLTNLVTLQRNDSLLMLANNPKRLEEIIEEQLRREQQLERERKAAEELNSMPSGPTGGNNNFNNPFGNNPNTPKAPTNASANASFPFYDPTQRAQGYNDFIKTWGDRKLSDNWRVSALAQNNAAVEEKTKEDQSDSSNNKVSSEENVNSVTPPNIEESKKKYYKDIPYSKDQKNKLKTENKEAAFNLAMLYAYELENPKKALFYFNMLNEKYMPHPKEDQIIFEQAKLYKQLGNSGEYNDRFDKLSRKYPESKYLKALKNQLIQSDENDKLNVNEQVQKIYNDCYDLYKSGNYKQVLLNKKEHDKQFGGNKLQANFDYLEAMCYAKEKEMSKYKSKLESITVSYPNTSVGENAQRNLDVLNNVESKTEAKPDINTSEKISKNGFTFNSSDEHYALIVLPKDADINVVKAALNDFHKKEYSLVNLEVTEFIIKDKKCVLIKGFKSFKKNTDYLNVLQSKNPLSDSEVDKQYTLISQKNLGILLPVQNLPAYLDFAKEVYK